MAARRGIVLMELIPCTFDTTRQHLGLCNPITGERHVIPPLECSVYVHGYAIITAADSGDLDGKWPPSSPALRVLAAAPHHRNKNPRVYLNSYYVATRSWSAPTLCLDSPRFSLVGILRRVSDTLELRFLHSILSLLLMGIHNLVTSSIWIEEAVFDKEAFREELRTQKLKVDKLEEQNFETSKIRQELKDSRIMVHVESFGKNIITIELFPQPYMHVGIAIIHHYPMQGGEGGDDTTAAWLPTVIRIPTAVSYPKYHPLSQTLEKWFDFNMGSLLVLYRSSAIFVPDLEKKVMEKVMDCLWPLCSDKLSWTPLAYEMDLVEFFVLQLDGLCRGLLE
uniref:Uncharacterized protein n=1 Tax=Aegilops tauschii TaxID=37682 RepID=M8BR31_AEGTA